MKFRSEPAVVASSLAMLLVLSACGGSSGDEAGPTDPDFRPSEQQASEVFDFVSGLSETRFQDMPTTGSARYDGYVEMDFDGQGVIGDLRLSTNFVNGNVSGRIENWIAEEAGRLTGNVPLAGSIAGARFDASGSATLTTTESDSVQADLELQGGFRTSSGDPTAAIGGNAQGTVNINNQGPQNTFGSFAGVKREP